jgi:F-type H+-transporting ATPase subunit gamma
MASFRELKGRIGGVRNIQQITRAMKMVAGARLRRAEQSILALRPFASRLDGMTARFLADAAHTEHPFFEKRPVKSVAVLSVSSDRGLCGAYNNRVVNAVHDLHAERRRQDFLLLSVGKRGTDLLRSHEGDLHRSWIDLLDPVYFTEAEGIGAEMQELFLSGRVDEVLVVFAEYHSPMSQVVTVRQLLPSPPGHIDDHIETNAQGRLPSGVSNEVEAIRHAASQVYEYEPDFESMLDSLMRYNMNVQLYRALLEAQASEHGARMMAMDNATENAEEMIEDMTLTMNRLRQESITAELIDVIGGVEAMD